MAVDNGTKICTKCHEVKPFDAFYMDGKYRAAMCKQCRAVANKAYRSIEINKQAASAYNKKWRAENIEKKRALDKRWREDNRSAFLSALKRWRHSNKTVSASLHAKWRAKNKDKLALWRDERRVSCSMVIPKWADMAAIERIYKMAADSGLTVDHIVPLKGRIVCGLHVDGNLQLLTRRQNAAKGNRRWPDMP